MDRFCFFFFQAEDGIRDVAVTGVQTCALPICVRRLARDPRTRLVAVSWVPTNSGLVQDARTVRSEEHTSELQSRLHLVCRLLLEKKKKNKKQAVQLHVYIERCN